MPSTKQAEAIIQAGYRALAKSCHPDAGGSHEAMLALGEAKDWLTGLLGGNGAGPKEEVKPRPRSRATWNPKEWCAFEDVTAILETEKAILCEYDGEEFWIPFSQIHDDSEVYEQGDTGQLIISRWLARKKGLA